MERTGGKSSTGSSFLLLLEKMRGRGRAPSTRGRESICCRASAAVQLSHPRCRAESSRPVRSDLIPVSATPWGPQIPRGTPLTPFTKSGETGGGRRPHPHDGITRVSTRSQRRARDEKLVTQTQARALHPARPQARAATPPR